MATNEFEHINTRLLELTEEWYGKLLAMDEETIAGRRNSQNRTIKEITGHLIDSASNNHQRVVRLQYTDRLSFPDYTQHNDTWIGIQDHQDEDWHTLVNLWKYFNLHLVHLFRSVDKSKLGNTWENFKGENVSLREMIEGYLGHTLLHLAEIEDLAS